MPITPAERAYYIATVHELNRAAFFGNCPNYLNLMDAEIARMDAADPAYNGITKAQIDAFSVGRAYGVKAGSPQSEVAVTARTGVTFRRKGVNA